uniref:Uncharacterized protein n=1 Tax=Glossina pallidipes TaxID=7398 RepID=A0A1A9ZF97_GLOPL
MLLWSNLEERQEIFTLQQYKEFNKLQVEKLKNNENNNNNNLKLITNNQTTIEIDQNKCDVAAEGVNVKITQEIETKKQFRVSEIPSVEIEPLIVNKNDTISATISSNSVNNKIINPEQQIKIQINSHIPTTTVTQSIFESKATSPVTAKLTATTTSTATASTTAPIAAAAAAAAAALLLQKNCYPLAAAKTQYVEGKRPKTVTSSIIRAAPIINNIPTTTSTSSVLQLQSPNGVPRAQSVTASVFTPLSQLKSLQTDKTIAAISGQQQQQQPIQQSLQKSLNQDMNKGYLTFAEDATELTMLKEEPDDFTGQLVAPNAVDACIPLDESTPLFGEMLVGLMGSYGSLLPDDINSLDSSVVSEQANKSNNNSALYQQASVAASTESIINPANQSPEGSSSLPSLCSPNSLSQEDDFPYYTMNVDDMDDLTMRAPYIPMNEQDDLPLLTSDEFMWYGNNTFTSEDLNMHTKEAETMQKQLQLQQTLNYQEQQSQQQQREQFNQQFSNSLCSSPASTVSSMSPSPLQQQQQQQLQQQSSLQISQQRSQPVFTTDSSELAALLCGTGDGTLSILNDHCLTTTSLANRGVNSASVNSSDGDGAVGGGGGGDGGSSSSSNDGDTNMNCAIGSSGNNIDGRTFNGVREQQQLQQQCLQQLQEQLQQTQHEQQLQQQQLLSNLNINSKKDKFNTTLTTAPILYDTIEDTFENIYEKNSANLDCWNEFLQIKPIENATTSTTTSTATGTAAITSTHQQQLQQRDNLKQEDCKQQLHLHLIQPQQPQQQPPQNIIINAVPLITIQSNNKQLLIPTTQHQQQQQQQQQQQSSNVKLLNSQGAKVTTVKLPPLTNTTTICRIAEHNNKQQQSKQQQQQQNLESLQNYQNNILHQQSHSNNKRHLTNPTTNSQIESKRLKNNAGATIELIQNNNESSIVEKATTTTTSATTATPTKTSTTTTQLLQQLIQTTNKPQKQHTDYKSRSNYNAIKDNRYGAADDGGVRSDVGRIRRKRSITPQTNALTELRLPRYTRLTNLCRAIAVSNSPDYNFTYVEGLANTLAFLCFRHLLIAMQFRTVMKQ